MHALANDFLRNAPLIGGEWLNQTSLGKAGHLNPTNNQAQADVHLGGAAGAAGPTVPARWDRL